MATADLHVKVENCTSVNLQVEGRKYSNVSVSLLQGLCSQVILGNDFLKQHKCVNFDFGGSESPLNICALAALDTSPPRLFGNLAPDCKPIATKSRKFSLSDKTFIKTEVRNLLKEGIIEQSMSPWRAQVLVTTNERHKKRMVVDYSQTINKYTELDAYPLPKIDELVNKIANYRYFSTIDLKSAYHQIPISPEEKPYTAFEADGQLYQFCRIPFGVTNGVSAFQRTINNLIKDNNLKHTHTFLDDITVCGITKEEHDIELAKFLAVSDKYHLTINNDKTVFSANVIKLLGYQICNGQIRPDPDR